MAKVIDIKAAKPVTARAAALTAPSPAALAAGQSAGVDIAGLVALLRHHIDELRMRLDQAIAAEPDDANLRQLLRKLLRFTGEIDVFGPAGRATS